MNEYLEIKNQAAWVDENGAVFIPLRGKDRDKHQRKEHEKVCRETMPLLYADCSENIESAISLRGLLAYRQPCCGRWFRPTQNEFGSWGWDYVYWWRKMWWKWRKLI